MHVYIYIYIHDVCSVRQCNRIYKMKCRYDSMYVHIGSMYAIYSNIYHQYTPFMLVYIPAPWIRHGYVLSFKDIFESSLTFSSSHGVSLPPRGQTCGAPDVERRPGLRPLREKRGLGRLGSHDAVGCGAGL